MTISFGLNTTSLKTINQLGKTTGQLNQAFERLSSGLRLNSASDGAADLAIADGLRNQSRLAGIAIRNANDGISLTEITDSTLSEIQGALQRMGELAEQSANGIFSNVQRSALSNEFLAIGSEIQRLAKVTEFNGVKLLSNSAETVLQVGTDGTDTSRIQIEKVLGTLQSLNLTQGSSEVLTYSLVDSTTQYSQSASRVALDAISGAINSISSRRGTLGASSNRLETAINFLSVVRENSTAAESGIRDADIAREVADMVRLQVLQQAGTAILAQANQQPQVALSLLQ